MFKDLICDMAFECREPVTHIGSKGYTYCQGHAVQRRQATAEQTRKLRPWELQWLAEDRTLPSYRPRPKPKEGVQ